MLQKNDLIARILMIALILILGVSQTEVACAANNGGDVDRDYRHTVIPMQNDTYGSENRTCADANSNDIENEHGKAKGDSKYIYDSSVYTVKDAPELSERNDIIIKTDMTAKEEGVSITDNFNNTADSYGKVPETGDPTDNAIYFIALFTLAVVAIIMMIRKKK